MKKHLFTRARHKGFCSRSARKAISDRMRAVVYVAAAYAICTGCAEAFAPAAPAAGLMPSLSAVRPVRSRQTPSPPLSISQPREDWPPSRFLSCPILSRIPLVLSCPILSRIPFSRYTSPRDLWLFTATPTHTINRFVRTGPNTASPSHFPDSISLGWQDEPEHGTLKS